MIRRTLFQHERFALAALFLLAPLTTGARADGVDRSLYHDGPAIAQTTITTIPVNPDDPISEETRQRNAGKRLPGEVTLYLGLDGAIDGVDVVKSIPECDELVLAWFKTHREHWWIPTNERLRRLQRIEVSFPPIGGWPSKSANKPVPAPPGTKPKTVPPHMFDMQALERETPHLPEKVREKHAGQDVNVMYYVTVGTDGHVTAVDPINSIPDVDAAVIEVVKRWRFKPQPLPLRSMIRFEFYVPPAPH